MASSPGWSKHVRVVNQLLFLAQHWIAHHERRTRKKTLGLTQEALRALVSYAWPGNVRELARVCSLLITHAKPGAVALGITVPGQGAARKLTEVSRSASGRIVDRIIAHIMRVP